jgi:hypothetical protein
LIDDLPDGRQVETPADYRSFIFCTANKTPVCSPPWRIEFPEFYFFNLNLFQILMELVSDSHGTCFRFSNQFKLGRAPPSRVRLSLLAFLVITQLKRAQTKAQSFTQ